MFPVLFYFHMPGNDLTYRTESVIFCINWQHCICAAVNETSDVIRLKEVARLSKKPIFYYYLFFLISPFLPLEKTSKHSIMFHLGTACFLGNHSQDFVVKQSASDESEARGGGRYFTHAQILDLPTCFRV